jgi:hypothetical protein
MIRNKLNFCKRTKTEKYCFSGYKAMQFLVKAGFGCAHSDSHLDRGQNVFEMSFN